jgi:hypothetical protein
MYVPFSIPVSHLLQTFQLLLHLKNIISMMDVHSIPVHIHPCE